LLSREEVATGTPDATPKATPPVDAEAFRGLMAAGRPSAREVNTAPVYAVGERVRSNSFSHSGHTRLPRYVRGRIGEIILYHGAHVLPDASAKLTGDAPEHLYTVRFAATELWGPDADPNHSVTADLWESYIERA
ncbi:MAG: SH3-like domain-containing protein, partial [Pseudomonadota bacterium]